MKKLNIDYISDIHLDFWISEQDTNSPKFKKRLEAFVKIILPETPSTVLILAGDQGHYFKQDKEFLLELLKTYTKILLVPGNHDMYLVSKKAQNKYKLESQNRIDEVKEFCYDTPGLYYLDGKVVEIDGFSFGGLGMWHDDSYGKLLGYSSDEVYENWKQVMNDSNLIFKDSKSNYSYDYGYGSREKVVSFDPRIKFKEEMKKLKDIEEVLSPDVMITHYGPIIPPNLADDYKNITTSHYYFDGSNFIFNNKPKLWIHGHTHTQYNFMYRDTNIVTNPLGYPSENTYTTIKTIELSK
jgi:Icc-related predicted phosphoesterase